MKIRLSGPIQSDSIVDGEGVRTVIWTQGCIHRCPGCHNPETWTLDKGILVDVEDVKKQIATLQIQDGVTFSGGDPMCQIPACLEIAKFCKKLDLDVWCYTGYTFEELLEMSYKNDELKEFMRCIDILVDGRFILMEKSLNLKFKGSRNQRIINMKSSLRKAKPVLVRKYKCEKRILESKKTKLYI